MIEAARISNEAPHPMRNLFKPQHCPQLTISLLFMMFQQFTGINVMVCYTPVMINILRLGTRLICSKLSSLVEVGCFAFAIAVGLPNMLACICAVDFALG